MQFRTPAIVCALRHHGEHGTIARLMTPEQGLMAGYVRGGRSRRLRPVLQPGNLVDAEFRARTDEQLASLTLDLVHSRGGLFEEPLAAAAIEWSCALTAATLPEGHGYPRLCDALDGVLAAVEAASRARDWAAALVRYELLLLSELGFGLDLNRCAADGDAGELAWVSPKSGIAVSREKGAAYAASLLPLPGFLRDGGRVEDWDAIFQGLAITGHFIARDLLAERRKDVMAARTRLVERLKRAA